MEKDLQKKSYLSDEERFADLINGLVGAGKEIVSPADLTEMDSQTGFFRLLPGSAGRKRLRKQHYRDLVKKAAFGMNFIVIGIKHQEMVHYLMPLRCLIYETDEYERQAVKIRKRVRRQKGISRAEFLSGFTKQDRLKPCITLVLYYGEDWDGAKDLGSLLDLTDIPEDFHGMFNNYHMYICEVRRFENTGVFKTDLKQVFDFIRYSEDPGKLYELVRTDPAYQELDEDAYDVIADYVDSMELREIKKENQEGGKVNMSNVAMKLIQMGRKEGMEQGIEQGIERGIEQGIERGIEQGIEQGREQGLQALIEMSIKFGSTKQETIEYIMEKMQMPRENE